MAKLPSRYDVVCIVGVVSLLCLCPTASWASDEDPCKDRPFKQWYREMLHMADFVVDVLDPMVMYFTTLGRDEQWRLAGDDALRRANPCALKLKNEYKDKPTLGTCDQYFAYLPKCRSNDFDCADDVSDNLILMFECFLTDFSHYLDSGNSDTIVTRDVMSSPFATGRAFLKAVRRLHDIEYSITSDHKMELFQLSQKLLKLGMLAHEFRYPVTLSGAVCEKDRLKETKIGNELEDGGVVIFTKLQRFFALPVAERLKCTTDEVMWEVDDCAAEVKKSYGNRADEGDCSSYFAAATGRCMRSSAYEFDMAACEVALQRMKQGLECSTTRLARDALNGFTMYSSYPLAGLAMFEQDYNSCVAGGWLSELEEAPDQRVAIRSVMEDLYRSYKRLESIASFGCKV